MYVITLKGDESKGKTPTINIAYKLLLKKGYIQVPGFFEDLKHNDFLDVLENSYQRVGIVSQGDYERGNFKVANHLAKLNAAGCDKVICACTSRKPAIESMIKIYPHLFPFIDKTIAKSQSDEIIDNTNDANTLISHL